MRQIVSLQPMEDHMGADIHTAALRGPDSGAGGNSLQTASGESPEALKCMDRIYTRAREKCEEEGRVERTCYELIAAFHSTSPYKTNEAEPYTLMR